MAKTGNLWAFKSDEKSFPAVRYFETGIQRKWISHIKTLRFSYDLIYRFRSEKLLHQKILLLVSVLGEIFEISGKIGSLQYKFCITSRTMQLVFAQKFNLLEMSKAYWKENRNSLSCSTSITLSKKFARCLRILASLMTFQYL
jgi:hypothetical protein